VQSLRNLRHPIAAILAAIALLATPALLFAHAHLVKSVPAANASLDTAPSSISLWFSEQPELRFTSVQLFDSTGKAIPLGNPSAIEQNGVSLVIGRVLLNGPYSVVWRTAASDGHATNGKFSFRVAGAGTAVAPPAQQPPAVTVTPVVPPPVAASQTPTTPAVVRWVELLSLLLIIGGVVFRLGVITQAGWPADAVLAAAERSRRWALAALVLFLVATVVRIAFQSKLLAASTTSVAAMVDVAEHTRWGNGWLIGAAGAVCVLLGLLIAARAMGGWFLAALGAVLICVSEALTGHAAALRHTALSISADVTHVLGAGAWMGALAMMALVGLPALGRMSSTDAPRMGSSLTRSYHTAAVDGVVLVVVSGLIAAFLRLPSVSALWTTDYGSWLFRKLIFVLVALGFGVYHWRRVVTPEWTGDTFRRFSRTALGELTVGLVIVALTSMLISTSLPQ
jgi:copper transport protein